MAEGLEKAGDEKGARENYQKALAMAPEDQKKRITAHAREAEVDTAAHVERKRLSQGSVASPSISSAA